MWPFSSINITQLARTIQVQSPKQGDCDAGCRHGLLCRAVKADNSDSWQCDHLPQ